MKSRAHSSRTNNPLGLLLAVLSLILELDAFLLEVLGHLLLVGDCLLVQVDLLHRHGFLVNVDLLFVEHNVSVFFANAGVAQLLSFLRRCLLYTSDAADE